MSQDTCFHYLQGAELNFLYITSAIRRVNKRTLFTFTVNFSFVNLFVNYNTFWNQLNWHILNGYNVETIHLVVLIISYFVFNGI